MFKNSSVEPKCRANGETWKGREHTPIWAEKRTLEKRGLLFTLEHVRGHGWKPQKVHHRKRATRTFPSTKIKISREKQNPEMQQQLNWKKDYNLITESNGGT